MHRIISKQKYIRQFSRIGGNVQSGIAFAKWFSIKMIRKRSFSRMTLFPLICINLHCGSRLGEVYLRDRLGNSESWNRILPNIYLPYKAVVSRVDTKHRCFFVLYTMEIN